MLRGFKRTHGGDKRPALAYKGAYADFPVEN